MSVGFDVGKVLGLRAVPRPQNPSLKVFILGISRRLRFFLTLTPLPLRVTGVSVRRVTTAGGLGKGFWGRGTEREIEQIRLGFGSRNGWRGQRGFAFGTSRCPKSSLNNIKRRIK